MLKLLKNRTTESDEALLLRYQQDGDRFVLGLLLRRYAKQIYGTCHYYLRHEQDTEDAAMEVCELIVRKLSTQTAIKSFKDWLFIVTRNYCFRQMKENQRLTELARDWQEDFLGQAVQNSPDETLYEEQEQLFAALDSELGQLSTQQRLCLTAFYWQGERYKTIAERLEMTTDEVRSAIQNGRRNLRNRLNVVKKD